jgi:hypothetical protein
MHAHALGESQGGEKLALGRPDATRGASGSKACACLARRLNAGDCGLIPVPERLIPLPPPPPPPPGSGKLGTPCARMQSASLSAGETPRPPVPVPGVCDDPHAATATTHRRPRTSSRRCDGAASACWYGRFYARPANSAVTPLCRRYTLWSEGPAVDVAIQGYPRPPATSPCDRGHRGNPLSASATLAASSTTVHSVSFEPIKALSASRQTLSTGAARRRDPVRDPR